MRQKIAFFLLAGLLLVPGYVKADVVFYTDRTVWEAAVNSDISIENFNSVTDKSLDAGLNEVGLIGIELLNHSPTSEYNFISDISYDSLSIDGSPFFRGIFSKDDIDSVTNLILPHDAYAFGGDFISAHSNITLHTNDAVVIEVNGAQYDLTEILDPSGEGDGFLGFISPQAFSVVSLFDPSVTDMSADPWIFRGGENFGLDNVSFAVPEPATLSLLGLGVFCLRRRRESVH